MYVFVMYPWKLMWVFLWSVDRGSVYIGSFDEISLSQGKDITISAVLEICEWCLNLKMVPWNFILNRNISHCVNRYHMLGMFLLIQLSIVVGDWLRRSALPTLTNSMRIQLMDRPFSPSMNMYIRFLNVSSLL